MNLSNLILFYFRLQKQIISEQKRLQEDKLRRKKEIMLEKFQKLIQGAKYDKDIFYRKVFTPTSSALLSIDNFIYK